MGARASDRIRGTADYPVCMVDFASDKTLVRPVRVSKFIVLREKQSFIYRFSHGSPARDQSAPHFRFAHRRAKRDAGGAPPQSDAAGDQPATQPSARRGWASPVRT